MLVLILLLSCFVVADSIELLGTHATYKDIQYVYQKPLRKPVGVLFLAHGCSHSSTDWWPVSSTCPRCVGLSIETSFTAEGLRRGYFVLAQSSLDRESKCWSGADISLAVDLIKHVYATQLENDLTIPLHLWGGSSGGSFVGSLASSKLTAPPVASVSVQIMSLRDYSSLPPTLFVLMSKDEWTLHNVESGLDSLPEDKKKLHRILKAHPGVVSRYYFFNHNNALSTQDSEILHKAFLKHDIIARGSLQIQVDPRSEESNWRKVTMEALPHIVPARDTLIGDRSNISELMNMAWCMHEITDEYLSRTFDWYDTNGIRAKSLSQ